MTGVGLIVGLEIATPFGVLWLLVRATDRWLTRKEL